MKLKLIYCIAIFAIYNAIEVQAYLDVEIKLNNFTYRTIGDKMTKYMNKTIKPCDDFYKFTCGNWSSVYNATKKIEKITVKDIHDKTLKETLKYLLNEQHITSDIKAGVKVKKFYASCINSDFSPNNGIRQIVDFLRREGGMPDLNHNWIENNFDWQATIRKFKNNYGFDILIGSEITTDFENKEKNKLYVGEIQLSELEKHHYFQIAHSDKLERYRNKIISNLKKLGIDNERSKRLAKEFIDLERNILKDSTELNENNKLIPIKVSQLQTKYSKFNWSAYFQAVLTFKPFENTIIERNPRYIESVLNVIQFTPKRRLANYIMWKVAQNFMENSIENFPSREDYCVNIASKYFPKVIHFMLYKKFYHIATSAKYKIDEITISIKNSFKQMILNITWMSDHLKNSIISEGQKINVQILKYEEYDLDVEFAQSVDINEINFFNNTLNIIRHNANIWPNKIYENADNSIINPLDINAYLITRNSDKKIQISIPTIFYPYFHVNYPKSMNFAKIGVLIARALIKAVDAESYIGNNKFENVWDENSITQYYHNKRCFEIQDESNSMTRTINEDLSFGMSSSVEVAFNAYLLWLSQTINVDALNLETLPAFDFTNTQLFFVSYAQNWCKSIYNVQPSDGTIEILPSIINFNEFSKEFNCQQGSWMNPKIKCSVWNNEL